MALVRALLAPTASDDGAGERFCAPLLGSASVRHCRLRLTFPANFRKIHKLAFIRFLSCHLFGPVNHGQTWRGWERSGEKGLIIKLKLG
jgi:hypothetical protein